MDGYFFEPETSTCALCDENSEGEGGWRISPTPKIIIYLTIVGFTVAAAVAFLVWLCGDKDLARKMTPQDLNDVLRGEKLKISLSEKILSRLVRFHFPSMLFSRFNISKHFTVNLLLICYPLAWQGYLNKDRNKQKFDKVVEKAESFGSLEDVVSSRVVSSDSDDVTFSVEVALSKKSKSTQQIETNRKTTATTVSTITTTTVSTVRPCVCANISD